MVSAAPQLFSLNNPAVKMTTTSAVYGFFKFTSTFDGRSVRCEVKKLPFTFGSSVADDIRIHAPKVQKEHLQVLRLGWNEEEGDKHSNLIIRPSLSEFSFFYK